MNELVKIKTDQLKTEISPVLLKANEIRVTNGEDYQFASDFLKTIKEAQGKVKSFFEPMKKKAHATWKAICNQENETLTPLVNAEKTIKNKMLDYRREEERRRLEEQRRLQAEAEARAAKERERLRKQAEKLKTPELREQRFQEAEEIEAPVVIVNPEIPKIEGQSIRKVWKARVISKKDFIKAAAESENLLGLVEINESALNKMAQALKGEIEIPGIEFYQEEILSMRTK